LKVYIVKNEKRLDEIVYKHYKTLDIFEIVLSFNTHLNSILSLDDKVYLPKIKIEQNIKQVSLW